MCVSIVPIFPSIPNPFPTSLFDTLSLPQGDLTHHLPAAHPIRLLWWLSLHLVSPPDTPFRPVLPSGSDSRVRLHGRGRYADPLHTCTAVRRPALKSQRALRRLSSFHSLHVGVGVVSCVCFFIGAALPVFQKIGFLA